MTISAGDVLRTSCNFTLGDGTLYQNVYHHRRVGLGIITDAAHITAISTWATAMYAELDDLVPTNVTEQLSSVDRIEWDVTEWKVVENIGVFTISFVPTVDTSWTMPNQMSPFVTFKTARPKTVGRKFLFAMSEIQYTTGLLTAATTTAIAAYADDAVNNVVVSAPLDYLVPGVPRTSTSDFEDFTVAIVTDVAGTQRRRRLGYGA